MPETKDPRQQKKQRNKMFPKHLTEHPYLMYNGRTEQAFIQIGGKHERKRSRERRQAQRTGSSDPGTAPGNVAGETSGERRLHQGYIRK